MPTTVKAAFQSELLIISVSDIMPIKTMTSADRKTDSYRRIAASIEHVGLIEALVVFPARTGNTSF